MVKVGDILTNKDKYVIFKLNNKSISLLRKNIIDENYIIDDLKRFLVHIKNNKINMDLYEIANRFIQFSLFDSVSKTRMYTDPVGYFCLIDNLLKYNSKYTIYSGKYNRSISGVVEVDLDNMNINVYFNGLKQYFIRDYIKSRI